MDNAAGFYRKIEQLSAGTLKREPMKGIVMWRVWLFYPPASGLGCHCRSLYLSRGNFKWTWERIITINSIRIEFEIRFYFIFNIVYDIQNSQKNIEHSTIIHLFYNFSIPGAKSIKYRVICKQFPNLYNTDLLYSSKRIVWQIIEVLLCYSPYLKTVVLKLNKNKAFCPEFHKKILIKVNTVEIGYIHFKIATESFRKDCR